MFPAMFVALGCIPGKHAGGDGDLAVPSVTFVSLDDPIKPLALPSPMALAAAKNESIGFIVAVHDLPARDPSRRYSLRIGAPRHVSGKDTIDLSHLSAQRIVAMPIDLNRAGYVRHTGASVAARRLPRALLPAAMSDGAIPLDDLQSPPGGGGTEPILLWIDLHIPPETRPGDFTFACDLLASGVRRPISSTQVSLAVYDFVLPDERHLHMIAELHWNDLVRHYPAFFEAVTPRLLNRDEERYTPAVRILDEMVETAQRHRAQVVIPQLQPTVKWVPRLPPQVDWRDFDSIVAPWLKGDAFADRVPLGHWPLPKAEYLDRFDRQSQLDYLSEAARHFDANGWLTQTAVDISPTTTDGLMQRVIGRVTGIESLRLSALAADVLGAHPRLRVSTPLEDDQVRFSTPSSPGLIDPPTAPRLITLSPGLVSAPPVRHWPNDLPPPMRRLRASLSGLIPYVGAGGNEYDVRLWAWLAFLRQAQFVQWDAALPQTAGPSEAIDPGEVVWFYPGEWFGLDKPVPTIQLKWVRRAQQDYEYLHLAKQRGEQLNALVMARLMTRPVEIQPNQPPDPVYALMSGAADPHAWTEVRHLLAQTILLRPPGQAVEPSRRQELNLRTLQWIKPQERPLLMPRGAAYWWDTLHNSRPGGNWISVDIGMDIYNASDETPTGNTLQFTAVGKGWEVRPQPLPIAALAMYHVRRFNLNARYNLDAIASPAVNEPIEITFRHGFTQRSQPIRFMLPIAASDRREGVLDINGSLEDWSGADAIHHGALVRMLDRPSLQKQRMRYATTPATVYTSWARDHFYLAFKVAGVSAFDGMAMRNFVEYQFRRAWGEDLVEMMIQPVYVDNTLGPIVHIVCKPNSHWIERKLDPRLHVDPWRPFEGAGVRYARTIDGEDWRGELAIPWKILTDPDRGRPSLLRFNFVQHNHATGESASWAGPIDFGRDESLMGLLHIRDLETPGMR